MVDVHFVRITHLLISSFSSFSCWKKEHKNEFLSGRLSNKQFISKSIMCWKLKTKLTSYVNFVLHAHCELGSSFFFIVLHLLYFCFWYNLLCCGITNIRYKCQFLFSKVIFYSLELWAPNIYLTHFFCFNSAIFNVLEFFWWFIWSTYEV